MKLSSTRKSSAFASSAVAVALALACTRTLTWADGPPATRPSAATIAELNRKALAATRALIRAPKETSKASEGVRKVFLQVSSLASESTVELRVNGTIKALGTVVEPQYIVTKASELGDFNKVTMTTKSGQQIAAKVVAVVEDHDLALIKVDATDLVPIKLEAPKDIKPGMWVATPMPSGSGLAGYGVISVGRRSTTAGYLGVRLGPDEAGKVKVVSVDKETPAGRAGIQADDVITAVNQVPMTDVQQLRDYLASQASGQHATVMIQRGDKSLNIEVVLAKRPTEESARATYQNTMGGELSARRMDFKAVYQHDTVLSPAQIGGPIVDLKGHVVGINIARSGRVESLAVPADVIMALLPDMKDGKFPIPAKVVPTTQLAATQPTTRPGVSRPMDNETIAARKRQIEAMETQAKELMERARHERESLMKSTGMDSAPLVPGMLKPTTQP